MIMNDVDNYYLKLHSYTTVHLLFTVYTHSHFQTAACVLCLVCALLGFLRVNTQKCTK